MEESYGLRSDMFYRMVRVMTRSLKPGVLGVQPNLVLRPYVKSISVVEFAEACEDLHLPDAGLTVAFPFRGECLLYGENRAPRAGITGLWDHVRHHRHSKGNGIVLVVFTVTGAAAMFRGPLHEIFNETVALENFVARRNGLDELIDRLGNAPGHAERVRAVEKFLLPLAVDARADALVEFAASRIQDAQGDLRMEKLASEVGLSQSALERRFRSAVGASPKKFASIVRMKHVIRLRKAGVGLTEIAYAAGYADQSHFIKDFRRMTGMAPGSWQFVEGDHEWQTGPSAFPSPRPSPAGRGRIVGRHRVNRQSMAKV